MTLYEAAIIVTPDAWAIAIAHQIICAIWFYWTRTNVKWQTRRLYRQLTW